MYNNINIVINRLNTFISIFIGALKSSEPTTVGSVEREDTVRLACT